MTVDVKHFEAPRWTVGDVIVWAVITLAVGVLLGFHLSETLMRVELDRVERSGMTPRYQDDGYHAALDLEARERGKHSAAMYVRRIRPGK